MTHLGNGVEEVTAFSWLFCMHPVVVRQEPVISKEDKIILRSLGQKVRELSELPIQKEKRDLWTAHHSLKETRPLVFIDPEMAWYEILPAAALRCTGNLARIWEYRMRKEIVWQEEIPDDRVCRAVMPVHHTFRESGFGIDKELIGGENSGAYHIKSVMPDYNDMAALKFRQIEIDWEKSEKLFAAARDVFDGILEVRIENSWWYSFGLTVDAIHLRGFENFLLDMYDYPDELHALMRFLSDEAMNRLDFLEQNGLLSLNNDGEFMGTGGYGWCDELPGRDYDFSKVKAHNMWGYGESQETVSVSPQAFDEFVLPYQLPLLSRFGLNAYGCCEPLDTRIDLILQKIPRLRKVTVSPWSDVRLMAEKLGKNYVYCRKMNPSCIATEKINEEEIRAAAAETFSVTKKHSCPAEVLMRDIRTLAGKKENAVRWVKIIREEIDRVYR